MRTAAADCASAAGCRLGFEQNRVEVRKVFELQARNFSSDETFDRLQRRNFFAVHERERVADVLGAAGPTDPMYVIFGVFGYIVINHVADAGDIETARRDVGRHHYFVFATLKSFERLNAFALGAIGMQNSDGMVSLF